MRWCPPSCSTPSPRSPSSALVNDVVQDPGLLVRAHGRRRQCHAADPVRAATAAWPSFIALARAAIAYVLLYRTTLGFEIRTVGANPSAARYAGHEPAAADHPDDEPVRAVRRPCRRDRDPGAGLLPGRRSAPPSASPASPSRCSGAPIRSDPAGRPAARRDACRCPGRCRSRADDPDRDHRRHPGVSSCCSSPPRSSSGASFRIRAERVTPGELRTVSRSYGEGAV